MMHSLSGFRQAYRKQARVKLDAKLQRGRREEQMIRILIVLLLTVEFTAFGFFGIGCMASTNMTPPVKAEDAKRLREEHMQLCHVKADHVVNTGAFEDDSEAANSMWTRTYNDCMKEQHEEVSQ
jgi:hypothetical protein